jgi:transcriptional regulator with XRE-family HTH domain
VNHPQPVTDVIAEVPVKPAVSGEVLRALREARGWDEPRLARELHTAAKAAGETVAAHHALVKMISAWETGKHRPSKRYLYRYREVFPDFAWPGGNSAASAAAEVLRRARQAPGRAELAALQLAAFRSGQAELAAFAAKLLGLQRQVDELAENLERMLGEAGQ